MAEVISEMLEAIGEVTPAIEDLSTMTREEFFDTAAEQMGNPYSSIEAGSQEALEAGSQEVLEAGSQDSFEAGFNESREELKKLTDPANVGNIESRWTATNIWKDAKSFGKFVGTEAGKGACFTGGMKIVEKIWEAASKKPGADENAKNAFVVSKRLHEAGYTMQQVSAKWQLWLANHYENRGSYGSVDFEGTSISRFQILQNKVSDMTKVQDEKIGPAITAASRQRTLDSLHGLTIAYMEMLDKAYLVSTDISTHEQLMIKDGLTDSRASLDIAKSALEAAL